jgi:GABA(A) receptor-associated protein
MFNSNLVTNQLFGKTFKRGRLSKPFKKTFSLAKRKDEAGRIIAKYPDRIPVICERKSLSAPELDRKKYLIPKDITLGNYMYVIRKRINMSPENSLYLFINGNLVTLTTLMSVAYEEYKSDDGFLYIEYASESTFGKKY